MPVTVTAHVSVTGVDEDTPDGDEGVEDDDESELVAPHAAMTRASATGAARRRRSDRVMPRR